LINLWPPNKDIHVSAVASELFQRYRMPENVSIEKWKQDFALATSLALKRGHLSKVSKGHYRVARIDSGTAAQGVSG